jgi:hypothetical protein
MSAITEDPAQAAPSIQHTWMIFEDNKTWAVPKRPKFVIKGSSQEIDSLIKRLEMTRYALGHNLAQDTHLSAEPIRTFESVDSYDAQEKAHFEAMLLNDVRMRATVSFSGLYPSTKN